MAMPIPNLSGQASSGATGQASGAQNKWGDFVVGGNKSSFDVPWYVWAALAVAAVVWAKEKR